MATWVFLHAHPDDESTQTSGTMAMAHERGDRVVLVVATDGEQGTTPRTSSRGRASVIDATPNSPRLPR